MERGILLLQGRLEFLGVFGTTGLTNDANPQFVDVVCHARPVLVNLLDAVRT